MKNIVLATVDTELKFQRFLILCVYICTTAPPRPIRIIEHKQLFSQTQEADGHDYFLSYHFDVLAWSLSVGGGKRILSQLFVLFQLKLKWPLSAQTKVQ